jgi:hypothetical protein
MHCLTSVRLGLLPQLLTLPVHRINSGAATEPPWVELCSPFPYFFDWATSPSAGRPFLTGRLD